MTAIEFPLSFLDTNVLVYAISADDTRRSPIAQKLLSDLTAAKALRTSTQVLQELFVTLTRKLRTPITAEQALHYLDQIAEWPVTVVDYGALKTAGELSVRAGLSFWDALAIVTAARSGAKRIYTDDLHLGQTILAAW